MIVWIFSGILARVVTLFIAKMMSALLKWSALSGEMQLRWIGSLLLVEETDVRLLVSCMKGLWIMCIFMRTEVHPWLFSPALCSSFPRLCNVWLVPTPLTTSYIYSITAFSLLSEIIDHACLHLLIRADKLTKKFYHRRLVPFLPIFECAFCSRVVLHYWLIAALETNCLPCFYGKIIGVFLCAFPWDWGVPR